MSSEAFGRASALFCAGCNARFDHVPAPGVCPQCGACVTLEPLDSLADTLLLKHLSDDPPEDAPPPADGNDELLGRRLHVYRCEALLGSGSMGRVYLAHHEKLHRKCALKVLSPRTVRQDIDYIERFLHEGRAAAALVHPNIVTTHAIGEADGFHFLEMEFVAGRTLQHLVRDEGRLTPVRATTLAARIADGLAAAHRQGILHRDLKADNVLLTLHGLPKIADFGLAKRILADDGMPDHYLVGTPNYMAPELFGLQPAGPASDVYALGVCYHLLLTGRLPFVGGSVRELRRLVPTEPLANVRREFPEIELEMAECLSLLLAKAPGNRPRDGIEAAQLLRAVAGQVRDIESLLNEAFPDKQGIIWMRSGNLYRLVVTLPDNRRQVLFIEPSSHATAERLLLIYSVCCAAWPEFYEEALRLNAVIPHGGLSIREVEGEAKFVMGNTYLRATVDPEEVRRSVLEVAARADAVEQLLTGEDRH